MGPLIFMSIENGTVEKPKYSSKRKRQKIDFQSQLVSHNENIIS